VSETMNLRPVPETMTWHRAVWAGRIMSAFVVIALVTDGTIQLFAPAQIAGRSRVILPRPPSAFFKRNVS
jgi:hypothetical protein